MCLGVPGRVIRWIDRDPLFARAEIQFAGTCREVHMACVPHAETGQYVIVHAGVAICALDESEAEQTLLELEKLSSDADVLDGESDEILG